MSILESVKKIAVEILWPWIKEYVWPAIQAKLITELPELISWGIGKIKSGFSENSNSRESEAIANAKKAEEKANNSSNELEIAELRKEAEIWKKVANQYKEDLAVMQEKMQKIEEATNKVVKEEVMKVNPEIDFESTGVNLKIGETKISLPSPE